jgi:hypothetical protein
MCPSLFNPLTEIELSERACAHTHTHTHTYIYTKSEFYSDA